MVDLLQMLGTSAELEAVLSKITGGKTRFVLVWAKIGEPPGVMHSGQAMPAVYMLEEACEKIRRDQAPPRSG